MFGRKQRQDDKGVNGKYNEQNQRRPGEAAHNNWNADENWYEPKGHNDRDVPSEFLFESVVVLFLSKSGSNVSIPTRAGSRVPVSAVRTYEYDYPENSDHTVCEVGTGHNPFPNRVLEACEENGCSQRNHNRIREVVGKLLGVRILAPRPTVFDAVGIV